MDDLLRDINRVIRKIADRDGIELPPTGGFRLKKDGLWEFVEGEGEYQLKDGHMRWILKL